MKKSISIIAVVLVLFSLCACGVANLLKGSLENAEINLDTQNYFSEADIEEALKVVEKKFSSWPGFVMHSIEVSYAGDDTEYCNSLGDGVEFDEAITFTSSFTTGPEDWSGFSANQTCSGWQWYLARETGGEWQLLTWGYC